MRLLPLVICSLALAIVSAGAAAALKPTAKDRADARAFVAAAEKAHKTGAAAVATLPNIRKVTDSTCGGSVAASFPGGSNTADPATYETLAADAYDVLILRVLGPTVAQYNRDIQAVHARDPVLRRYAAYVAKTMVPTIERYAKAPGFDICKLFRDWQATGFKAGFDWVSDAHIAADLAAGVESAFAKLEPPPSQYNPIGNRLVAFGVRSSVAFWFPNALLHATGQ